VSFGKILNAVFHLGAKQSIPVVVAKPDERHANRTASVLEWYNRRRVYSATSGSNEEEENLSDLFKKKK